jgi:hypothetical protein
MTRKSFLMTAAVAGLMGAAVMAAVPAHAADAKGQCVGANSCKGKGACKQDGANDCKGKNGCKGKGFMATTQAKCDKMAAKNKDIHFVASGDAAATKK